MWWLLLISVLVGSGALVLYGAPGRARAHAGERKAVLRALSVLPSGGTEASVAREMARASSPRLPVKLVRAQLTALIEDGIVEVREIGSSTPKERLYRLLVTVPPHDACDDARPPSRVTVYHDGACPLCRAEIAQYRRARGSHAVVFTDVSGPDPLPAPDLSRAAALARFHVRSAEGELLSGAAAFAALWRTLPGWRWLGLLIGSRPILPLAELAYRAFLPLRPRLARLLVASGALR